MYYCKIDNGQIGFPQLLPNKYGNVIGGFDKLSNSKLKDYGFYPYVEPVFDPFSQELAELVFNQSSQTVTRNVVAKVYDIEQMRVNKLASFEQFSKGFRNEITEMFAEEILLNELPVGVVSLLQVLKQRKVEVIAEINGFADNQDIDSLINYKFESDEVQQFRAALASFKE